MADNDIGGQMAVLEQIFKSDYWLGTWEDVGIEVVFQFLLWLILAVLWTTVITQN